MCTVPDTVKAEDVGEAHEDLPGAMNGKISGLLMLQNGVAMNFIEGEQDDVTEYLKEAHQLFSGAHSVVSGVRIVTLLEDVPARSFPFGWRWRSVVTAKEQDVDLEGEGIPTASFDAYERLRQLGVHLTAMKEKDDISEAAYDKELDPANLRHRLSDYLTSAERCAAFTETTKLPSMDEFIRIYGGSTMVVPEKERVWPMQEDLRY